MPGSKNKKIIFGPVNNIQDMTWSNTVIIEWPTWYLLMTSKLDKWESSGSSDDFGAWPANKQNLTGKKNDDDESQGINNQ